MRILQIKNYSHFLWLLSAICIFVTSLPYLYGYAMRPGGALYSGIHHIVQGDTNVYLTMIEQTRAGHVLYNNLFTSEPNGYLLFNPLWLILGIFAKITGASALLAFHIGRIALIPLLIFSIDRLIRLVVEDERKRKIVLIITAIASGVGLFFDPFLFSVLNPQNRSTDIWVPEGNTFLTMMQSPHFIISLTLLLNSLVYAFRSLMEKRLRLAVYAGLISALLFLLHPFYVPTVYGVVAVWMAVIFFSTRKIVWKQIAAFGILVGISAPILLYFAWMDHISPVVHAWSAQNNLPSPDVWFYLTGYGLLTPLAVYACIRKFSDIRWRLLIFWGVTTAALLYVPLAFQRRLVEGLHVMLCLFAAIAAIELYERLRHRSWLRAVTFAMLLAVLLPMTNVKILVQDFYDYTFERRYPYYIPRQDRDAFGWLNAHTTENDIIFSSFVTGNYIPAYTLRRVFIGHGPQTIYLKEKEAMLNQFFNASTDDFWRKAFLQQWQIAYVWYGDNERPLGNFQPQNAPYLQKVYTSGSTSIYQVTE